MWHRLILCLLWSGSLWAGDHDLFTSFRRNGETGVFFAISPDGRTWTTLNENRPF